MSRVIVGDGPLRDRVPEAVGFVPPRELGAYYERAAVVCVPSRREGYGVVARDAMAYGRPVVATEVGGLVDAVQDGVTGVLVPPRDVAALRASLQRLLADRTARRQPGRARLSEGEARAGRHLGRVRRPHGGTRRGGRGARGSKRSRRQGRRPEPCRARDRERARRLLGCERDVGARRTEEARAQLRRPRRRLCVRPIAPRRRGGGEPRRALLALRA